MANHPQDWRYPQAAGSAGPPAAMVNAVRLMYAGAVITVVLAVTVVLTMHSSQTVHIGNPASGQYKAGYITGGLIAGLVAGVPWLWMAWANKRGRSWARILSTIFFGLLTLYTAASFAALPAAPTIVIIIEWAAGLAATVFLWQRQSSQYYRVLSQSADDAPPPLGQQYGQQQQPYTPSPYGQSPQHSSGRPPYGQPGPGQPSQYG